MMSPETWNLPAETWNLPARKPVAFFVSVWDHREEPRFFCFSTSPEFNKNRGNGVEFYDPIRFQRSHEKKPGSLTFHEILVI